MASSEHDLRAELDDLGRRIDRAIAEYQDQGALHGTERETAAEIRLQHSELTEATRAGGKRRGELAHDISVLKSTFERWLARVDKRSETFRT